MKAARYYGPQDVRIEDIPPPGPPGPDEVTLQILAASLCGTDASQYVHPTMIPLHYAHPISGHHGPVVLGHEVVGRILAKGAQVTDLEIGDRVVPGCGWWCGTCQACRVGRLNICDQYFLYGIHRDGGLSEQALFPAKMCIRVPDGCHDTIAALAQPTAVALHIVKRIQRAIGSLDGRRVALFGAGNIGSLILAVLHARQVALAQVVVSDVEPARLATARRLGATQCINGHEQAGAAIRTLAPGGVDLAIEATGIPSLIQEALTVVRPGGALMLVGIPSCPVELSLQRLVIEEKTVWSSNGQVTGADLPEALALLATTDLATVLNPTIIALDDVVRDGLVPLVEHRVPGKIVVTMS